MNPEKREGENLRHPKVSPSDVAVIVAAKNEEENIRECIESLLIAGGKAEIIVVDDGSEDGTSKILNEYSDQIQVLQGEGRGPGAARNLAIQKTEKDWIAFTDADCEVDENWLSTLCSGISERDTAYASIGGLQKISRRAEVTEALVGSFLEVLGFVSDYMHEEDLEVSDVSHNPTCNVLYSREAIEEVGGFDEELWPTEDLDLDFRLDQKKRSALFDSRAFVYHRRPKTWALFGKMMRRYGFAHAQFMKKHGISQRIHYLPFVAPFLLGLFLALLLFNPFICIFFTLIGMFFTMLLFFLKTKKIWISILFTGILAYIVTSWLVGFYRGLMGRRRIFKLHA